MANKKNELRQARRKKRAQIKAVTACAAVAAVCLIIAIGYFVIKHVKETGAAPSAAGGGAPKEYDPNAGKGVVAHINGYDITAAEFSYHLLNQAYNLQQRMGPDVWGYDFEGETAENLTKQQTLEYIRILKECRRRAGEEGARPGPDTDLEVEELAAYYAQSFSEDLTKGYGLDEAAILNCLTDISYFRLMFEKYTADYAPSDGYEEELARYVEEEQNYYIEQAVAEGDTEPFTDEELKSIADRVTESYLTQLKSGYFETIVTPWVENIPIETDAAAIDAISLVQLVAANGNG